MALSDSLRLSNLTLRWPAQECLLLEQRGPYTYYLNRAAPPCAARFLVQPLVSQQTQK